jgi:transposase-like protein
MSTKGVSDDRLALIRQLAEQGAEFGAICRQAGVSKPTLRKYEKLLGLSIKRGKVGRKPSPPSGNIELDERREYQRVWYAARRPQ